MLSAGGALLIGTGAMTSYIKAQQPEPQVSDLTLANLEAMAFIIDPDELDMNPGGGISKSCTKAQQAGIDTPGAVKGMLCGCCCNTYYVRPKGSGTCTPF